MIERGWKTLIIVVGHGQCVYPERPYELTSWRTDFTYAAEPQLYVQHILAAVMYAAANLGASLCFSGGPTRKSAGNLSEAKSYYDVATVLGWFGFPEVAARTRLDPYSTDSLCNVGLPTACFIDERSGGGSGSEQPEVIVFGFAFKEERFLRHGQALGLRNLRYVGVNNPPEDDGILERAIAGERVKVECLKTDPYLKAEKWRHQRSVVRSPFGVGCPQLSDPGLQRLAEYLTDIEAKIPVMPWGSESE